MIVILVFIILILTANLLSKKPVEDKHLEEIAKRDSIVAVREDSLIASQIIIDSLNEKINAIGNDNRLLSRNLEKSTAKIKKIEGSLKKLSNDELVREANEMYGGSDTTELTILLSRPTTEFLVEEAKKTEILFASLEFSKSLNRNYQEQILLQAQSIDLHIKDKDTLREIIDLRNEQLAIETDAYNNLHRRYAKEIRKRKFQNKVLIGVGVGLLTYGLVK